MRKRRRLESYRKIPGRERLVHRWQTPPVVSMQFGSLDPSSNNRRDMQESLENALDRHRGIASAGAPALPLKVAPLTSASVKPRLISSPVICHRCTDRGAGRRRRS